MNSKSFTCLLAMLFGLSPVRAATADDCKESSGDCVAVGKWNFSLALGAGVRTNPLLDGENIPLLVIPEFSYYGRRFFIDKDRKSTRLNSSHLRTSRMPSSA